MPVKNLHLLFSALLVVPVAFCYGCALDKLLPLLFDFQVSSIDLKHVFRAIMGLYLAMAVLWILGIFKPRYWETATITNIVFMGGLVAGRIASIIIDGVPSPAFCIGLIVEILLAVWGCRNLKMYAWV